VSQAYKLFHKHALTALKANDSAAALQIVNDPIGHDLKGTDFDQPRVWFWFRDTVGEQHAILVRMTVEEIIRSKDFSNPQAYAFAVNAESILARLDTVGISPCDPELRRAITTIIQTSSNQDVINAFSEVLHLGYQSRATRVFGRPATEADFEAAYAVHSQRVAETARSNREESVIDELNTYADAGREVIRNGGTVDAAWAAIKAAMAAGGR